VGPPGGTTATGWSGLTRSGRNLVGTFGRARYSRRMDRRARLLLAEANPALAALLGEVFTEAGFVVDVVNDGALAVDRFMRIPSDVVLLDLGLTVGRAGAILIQLRRIDPDVPVVVLSGELEDDPAGWIACGAVACLVKPTRLENIARAVDTALTGTRLALDRTA